MWKGGDWHIYSLVTLYCDEVVNKLHIQDSLVQANGPLGCYSIASDYLWILRNRMGCIIHHDWKWKWKLTITKRCKVLLWLIMLNALPTNVSGLLRGWLQVRLALDAWQKKNLGCIAFRNMLRPKKFGS